MAGGQQISREKHVDIRVRNLLIGYSSESLFFCLLVKKIKASLLLFCHERHERREQIYHGREESESHPSQNLLKLFSRSFSILLYVLQFYGIQYTCKNYKNLNKWRFKIYCNMLSLPLVLGWAYSDPSLSYLYDRLRPRNDKDLHALTVISQTIKEVLLYDHLCFLNKFFF